MKVFLPIKEWLVLHVTLMPLQKRILRTVKEYQAKLKKTHVKILINNQDSLETSL